MSAVFRSGMLLPLVLALALALGLSLSLAACAGVDLPAPSGPSNPASTKAPITPFDAGANPLTETPR